MGITKDHIVPNKEALVNSSEFNECLNEENDEDDLDYEYEEEQNLESDDAEDVDCQGGVEKDFGVSSADFSVMETPLEQQG